MSLPGTITKHETFCKEHNIYCGNADCGNTCTNLAKWRIQGETDSWGAEYSYVCDDCLKTNQNRHQEWLKSPEALVLTECDLPGCHKMVPYKDLIWWKDAEEGTAACPHQICPDCKRKEYEYWAEEDRLTKQEQEQAEQDYLDQLWEIERQEEKDHLLYEEKRMDTFRAL